MMNTQAWRGNRLFALPNGWRTTWLLTLCTLGGRGSVCAEIVQPAIVIHDQSGIFDFSSSDHKEPKEVLQKGAGVFAHLKTEIKNKETGVVQQYFIVTSTSGSYGYIAFEDVEMTHPPEPFTDFFIQNILSDMEINTAIDKAKRLNRKQQEQLVLSLSKYSLNQNGCQTMVALGLGGPMVLRHAARNWCSAMDLSTIAGSPEGVLNVMDDVPSPLQLMRDLKVSVEAKMPFLKVAVRSRSGRRPRAEAADVLLAQLKSATEKEKRDIIQFFTECLGDPNPTIRRVAAMAFCDPRIDPASATEALELAGQDKDQIVRENALAALDRMNKVHPRPPINLMENNQ